MFTRVIPALGCWVMAATGIYGAPIPINYSLTKNYSFSTNLNVVPTLNETRYGHVFDYSNAGGGIASNTAQTYTGANASYDPFAADSYYLNAATLTYGIFNYPKGKASVPVTRETVNNLTLAGSPYNDPTNAGGASANVNATVTALAAKTATGTLAVSGSTAAPAAGENLFSIAYGQLTASVNGANLAGTVTNAEGMKINNLSAPRGIGSTTVKSGAADPVDLFEYDSGGNPLSSSLLFSSQGEVDGYGMLDWENNALNVTADNASLYVTANPFSSGDPSGTLQLIILNDIVSFATTGTAFQSCQATETSGSGSFSCVLPTTESFNYSYNSSGNPITVTADFEDVGYTQTTTTPEPGTALTMGLGLIVGVKAWMRCSRRRT